MARARELVADRADCGSVILRSSGPDDWPSNQGKNWRARMTAAKRRRSFIRNLVPRCWFRLNCEVVILLEFAPARRRFGNRCLFRTLSSAEAELLIHDIQFSVELD